MPSRISVLALCFSLAACASTGTGFAPTDAAPDNNENAGNDTAAQVWDAQPPTMIGTEVSFHSTCGILQDGWTMTWVLEDSENYRWSRVDSKTTKAVPEEWLPAECLPQLANTRELYWFDDGSIEFADVHFVEPTTTPNSWLGYADLSGFTLPESCNDVFEAHEANPPVVAITRTN